MVGRKRTRHWFGYGCGAVLVLVGTGFAYRYEVGQSSRAHTDGEPLVESDYGLVVEQVDFQLSAEEKNALLSLARSSVETWVRSNKRLDTALLSRKFPNLTAHRACFVTLRRDKQLRGCIGSLEPRRALVDDVNDNAVSAAVNDTRFRPVQESELPFLHYSISVLDLPRVLRGVAVPDLPAYLQQHKPGLIIEYRGRRSTFLPSVWEELPDPEDFLARLCRKQGSPPNCWMMEDVRISTYGSIEFAPEDG